MKKNLKGLTDQEVLASRQAHGSNELSKKPQESLWSMFLGAFNDIWIKVLCGALLLKIGLAVAAAFIPSMSGGNDVIEIVSILIAIGLATGFSTVSEYRNTTRSEALQEEYNKTYAKVMRNGKLVNILTSEIVKDDIVLVQAGDKVPVDGLIISGDIKVAQAALNGESRDENKSETDSMDEAESDDFNSHHKVFMGSVVTSGEAYMIATVIGDKSELGKINASLQGDDDEEERKDTSSLKLEKVATAIGKIGVTAAVVAGVLQVALPLINGVDQPITPVYILLAVAEAVMLMASIVIMAVPEGLPMMNSLVQSMNTESMYKKNILVSHKAAFSDSAYLNILFSDKTGTITEGRLALVEFITGGGKIIPSVVHRDFVEAITVNNLAKVSSEGKAIGSNNMDRALLTYALANGYKDGQNDPAKVKSISGFDSEKKCATVDMKDGTIYWKGATEVILGDVTHYIDENGEEKPFTKETRAALEKSMSDQAKRTMKMLSVAKIDGKKTILYAVLCLRDNVRKDAIDTVKVLNKAGIQVVMVTGDAEETAIAIAKEATILQKDTDIVLTHEQLEAMSDEELTKAMPNLRVVSRAKPLDKKRLVTIAQAMDSVCGMTGDGVNDSPALKQADVGFAMGDGTAVAQEAGDVVILNNSLTSIKDCVLNSRTMAKSVGKFLIFQLTVNVSTLLMNILAPVLGWMEPFSIVQILWINLIMDTLAAMAFGGEPILDRYMDNPPIKRTDSILTKYIKSAIGCSSVFITLGAILILENIFGIVDFVMPAGHANPELYEKTFMFAFFIYSIIFNSINTRSETINVFEHINENKRFIWVMGAIFIMQTIIIQVGGAVFGTVALTTKALLIAMGLALLIIPVDMLRKLIMRTGKKN